MKLEMHKTLAELMKVRGIEDGGAVQKFVDSEVIRRSDPFVPFLTGALKNSAISATVYGSGEVVYNTPYAKRQYHTGRTNGMRGAKWFERMKAVHKDSILAGAIKIAGGK